MQGQGDNKHSIDSDDEEDDRQKFDQFDKMAEDDMLMEGQEDVLRELKEKFWTTYALSCAWYGDISTLPKALKRV